MPSLAELTAITPQPTGQMTAIPQAPARPMAQPDDVFSFILKGLNDSPTNGNRNNFVHTFASDCNRFAVNENDCFQYCLQWQERDFTQSEIRQAVRSAYTRTAEHGTKEYKPMEHHRPAMTRPPTPGRPTQEPVFDLEKWRITDRTPITIPEPTIRIAGETITTSEAMTVISGGSKTGKTALYSIMIAGAIAQDGYDGIDEIEILHNDRKRAVIHIDTEQARHLHQVKHKTILKRANLTTCPDYFLSYNIRQLDIENYSKITTAICEDAFKNFNGIHSVWIDGGADYIADVNDATLSNGIVKYFEDISVTYHCPVIIILHTNPNGEKERGHFGSQCQRKAEAVLTVKNDDDDVSFIEARFLRQAGKNSIPRIQFYFDKSKGYHVGCGTKSAPIDRTQKKAVQMQDVCNNVFGGQKALFYHEAIDGIISATLCSERTAKEYFKTLNVGKLITQGEDKRWRKN